MVEALVASHKQIRSIFLSSECKIRAKKNEEGQRVVTLQCNSIEHAMEIKSKSWIYEDQLLHLEFVADTTFQGQTQDSYLSQVDTIDSQVVDHSHHSHLKGQFHYVTRL